MLYEVITRTLKLGLMMSEGAQNSRTIRAFIDHAKAEITPVRAPGLQVRGKGVP